MYFIDFILVTYCFYFCFIEVITVQPDLTQNARILPHNNLGHDQSGGDLNSNEKSAIIDCHPLPHLLKALDDDINLSITVPTSPLHNKLPLVVPPRSQSPNSTEKPLHSASQNSLQSVCSTGIDILIYIIFFHLLTFKRYFVFVFSS